MSKIAVYVDEALYDRLRLLLAETEIDRLVAKLLAERAATLERMREGYLATREDRAELNADWRQLDDEGWPECTS